MSTGDPRTAAKNVLLLVGYINLINIRSILLTHSLVTSLTAKHTNVDPGTCYPSTPQGATFHRTFSPREDLAGVREGGRVEAARGDLRDRLGLQRLQHPGQVLVAVRVGVAHHPVLLVPPRVHLDNNKHARNPTTEGGGQVRASQNPAN